MLDIYMVEKVLKTGDVVYITCHQITNANMADKILNTIADRVIADTK